jgi:hypothetical protein
MTSYCVGPKINEVRTVRAESGQILGFLREGKFEATAFPGEWGMEKWAIEWTWAKAQAEGRVVFEADR